MPSGGQFVRAIRPTSEGDDVAKVDPNNPKQVTQEGHAEEPQSDIQRRVHEAEDARPGSGAMDTNLDPVKKPETNPPS